MPEDVATAAPLAGRYVLLDLETTGAHPERDRITEIALLRFEGGRLVERWQSLVRPDVPIPPLIERLVGITNAMVADAPPFEALAPELLPRLADAVLVAHNARFDYGFLRQAFRRCGLAFESPVLCTVKLSRALYPQYHKHGLDSLIERHGLSCSARHRAMGDAEVLAQFLDLVQREFPPETLLLAKRKAMQWPSRPPGLADGVLESLPDVPGVYLMYGENDLPLYLGKSKRLRSRVLDHFSQAQHHGTEAEIARQIRRLDWLETAGELEALLLESELVKQLKPLYNRQLRERGAWAIEPLPEPKPRGPVVGYRSLAGTDPADWLGRAHGLFPDRKHAEKALRQIARTHALCPQRLGLEPLRRGPCLAHQMKQCLGACAGKESPEVHDARLRAALATLPPAPWPYAGPVRLTEHDPERERHMTLIADRWCLLARFDHEPAPEELAAALERPRRFDADLYRILAHAFATTAPHPLIV